MKNILGIVICLFYPFANQVDIASGMSQTLCNRCAHVRSVPCEDEHKSPLFPFSSLLFLSSSHHPCFLTFEMGIASSHLFTSPWSLLCLCCFQLHSNIKGETGKSCTRSTLGVRKCSATSFHEDLWPLATARVLEDRNPCLRKDCLRSDSS